MVTQVSHRLHCRSGPMHRQIVREPFSRTSKCLRGNSVKTIGPGRAVDRAHKSV